MTGRRSVSILVAAAAAFTLAGCSQPTREEQALANLQERIDARGGFPGSVTYEISGTAETVSITMETPTGTSQQAEVSLPWESSSQDFNVGDSVYVSAQNEGESGTVRCKITGMTGKVLAENSSSGAYTIATCSGQSEN